MANFVLNAKARTEDKQGKGASRRLRREALVPAIIYGGHADPVAVTLELREVVKSLEDQAFFSSIIKINVDGQEQEAIIKALQRHPAKNTPMHADFLRITRGEELKTHVPLNFINTETAKGVKAGGILEIASTDVEVSVLPRDLPENIVVDVAQLDVNQVIRLADLVLPNGVTLIHENPEQVVVSIAYVKEDTSDAETDADDSAAE